LCAWTGNAAKEVSGELIKGEWNLFLLLILMKSGEREVRLPIWVCQAAPGGTGDLLN
jgi:hypothetical protein